MWFTFTSLDATLPTTCSDRKARFNKNRRRILLDVLHFREEKEATRDEVIAIRSVGKHWNVVSSQKVTNKLEWMPEPIPCERGPRSPSNALKIKRYNSELTALSFAIDHTSDIKEICLLVSESYWKTHDRQVFAQFCTTYGPKTNRWSNIAIYIAFFFYDWP